MTNDAHSFCRDQFACERALIIGKNLDRTKYCIETDLNAAVLQQRFVVRHCFDHEAARNSFNLIPCINGSVLENCDQIMNKLNDAGYVHHFAATLRATDLYTSSTAYTCLV